VIDTKTLNAPAPPPMDAVVVRPSDDGSDGGWSPAGNSGLPREVESAPLADGQILLGGGVGVVDGNVAPRPINATPAAPGPAAAPRHGVDHRPKVLRSDLPVAKTRPDSRPSLKPAFEIKPLATTLSG
jgi:hypothetical protein